MSEGMNEATVQLLKARLQQVVTAVEGINMSELLLADASGAGGEITEYTMDLLKVAGAQECVTLVQCLGHNPLLALAVALSAAKTLAEQGIISASKTPEQRQLDLEMAEKDDILEALGLQKDKFSSKMGANDLLN